MTINPGLLASVTLMYATPIAFAAEGGVLCERSGVTNIGLEGMMSMGASFAVIVSYYTHNPWLGFLAAGLAGGILALLHAFASVTCLADQTVSGVAMNLLGGGIAFFAIRFVFDTLNTPSVTTLPKVYGQDSTVYLAFLTAVLLCLVFYTTPWGLRLQAVGEHPGAADTMGISVYRYRYICTILSGVLAGFGGASVTLGIISNFTPVAISGQGFIALAAVIFGKWKPHSVYGACLLFGCAQALAVMLGGTDWIPSQIISMLPYWLTLLLLVTVVGRSAAPKANGVPYRKGTR